MPAIGQSAPDFKLQDQNETWVTLDDYLKHSPLLIVFYPGDFTPVCTKQLCAYQDALNEFVKLGLMIVGISKNSPDEHQEFKKRYGFSFPLLSDPDRTITKAYGVTSLFLLGGTSRAVFVVGQDKKIKYRYVEPTTLTHRKPGELLQILGNLRSEQKL